MYLDMDPALSAIIELVRETHAPVDTAITKGHVVNPLDVAAVTGAVGALLNAIDARRTPPPAHLMKAAA